MGHVINRVRKPPHNLQDVETPLSVDHASGTSVPHEGSDIGQYLRASPATRACQLSELVMIFVFSQLGIVNWPGRKSKPTTAVHLEAEVARHVAGSCYL
jgi:hypothetical protein